MVGPGPLGSVITSPEVAGFQVISTGRFWVIAEDEDQIRETSWQKRSGLEEILIYDSALHILCRNGLC